LPRAPAKTHQRDKNVPPGSAVTTPMGRSSGAISVRAATSAPISRMEPASADTGNTCPCSPPTTGHRPAQVRRHQPDESDCPAHGHRRAGHQCIEFATTPGQKMPPGKANRRCVHGGYVRHQSATAPASPSMKRAVSDYSGCRFNPRLRALHYGSAPRSWGKSPLTQIFTPFNLVLIKRTVFLSK
jgi:hypothetical protein